MNGMNSTFDIALTMASPKSRLYNGQERAAPNNSDELLQKKQRPSWQQHASERNPMISGGVGNVNDLTPLCRIV